MSFCHYSSSKISCSLGKEDPLYSAHAQCSFSNTVIITAQHRNWNRCQRALISDGKREILLKIIWSLVFRIILESSRFRSVNSTFQRRHPSSHDLVNQENVGGDHSAGRGNRNRKSEGSDTISQPAVSKEVCVSQPVSLTLISTQAGLPSMPSISQIIAEKHTQKTAHIILSEQSKTTAQRLF